MTQLRVYDSARTNTTDVEVDAGGFAVAVEVGFAVAVRGRGRFRGHQLLMHRLVWPERAQSQPVTPRSKNRSVLMSLDLQRSDAYLA
jgi:hypothetical protein